MKKVPHLKTNNNNDPKLLQFLGQQCHAPSKENQTIEEHVAKIYKKIRINAARYQHINLQDDAHEVAEISTPEKNNDNVE